MVLQWVLVVIGEGEGEGRGDEQLVSSYWKSRRFRRSIYRPKTFEEKEIDVDDNASI